MPGTAAICSTGASRTRFAEPNTLSSSRRRFGPTPGRSSNADLRRLLRAQVAVVRDREPVGLVAQPLDEVQRLRRGGEHHGIGPVRQDQLLALLGQADQRQVVEAQLVEHLLRGADLARGRRR